jgi:hypothetical protein
MLPLHCGPELNSKQARQNLANCKGWPAWELEKQRTGPTYAIEVLLGLSPLHLQVEAEGKVGNYGLRCNDQWKPNSEGFGHAYMPQDMRKNTPYIWRSDKMISTHV